MRLLALALAAVLLAPTADAQFGRVLDRAKRAAEEAVDGAVNGRQASEPEAQTTPTSTPPTSSRPSPETAPVSTAPSAAGGPMAPTGPFPTGAGGHPTGIDVMTLWDDIGETEAGSTMRAPAVTATVVVFPASGAVYEVVLTDGAGAAIAWAPLTYEANPDVSAFGAVSGDVREEIGAGTYRLSIRANGHEIGAAAFEVRADGGDDPFDPRTTLTTSVLTDGVASFIYPTEPAGSGWGEEWDGALRFQFWLPIQTSTDVVTYRASLLRGGTVLNPGDRRGSVNRGRGLYPSLREVTFARVIREGGATRGYAPITLDDLTDGDYRIEVTANGGAPIATYRFRVEGGTPVTHPRSALDTTPRADFLLPMSALKPFEVRSQRSNNGAYDFELGHRVWLSPER